MPEEQQAGPGAAPMPGNTLRKRLDDLQAAGERLPLAGAIEVVRQVCLAVDEARRRGTPYGDVTPEAIVLMPEAGAPLGSRPALAGPSAGDVAAAHTLAYMSPEQAIGDATDARSDVYCLGVLLYELAVGRLPFAPRTLTEAIRCHTREQPPAPCSLRPDLPEPLEQTILTALAKDPAARFADAGALAGALAALQPAVAVPIQAQPPVQEPAAPPAPPAEPTGDVLTIIAPDGAVRSLPGRRGAMRIGRSPDNEIVLDYAGVEPHHARLLFEEGTCRVESTSAGETSLGSSALRLGAPEAWSAERVLRIGPVRLHLQPVTPRAPQPTTEPVVAPPEPPPLQEVPPPKPAQRVPVWAVALGVVVLLGGLGAVLWATALRPPVIRSLTIDPPAPVAGQAITIHWSLDNAQSVAIEPLTGPLDAASGQYTIAAGLAGWQSLTFIARNRFGSVSQPLAIAVAAPTPVATRPPATVPPTVRPTQAATAEPTLPPTRPPTASPTPTTCPPPGAKFSAANTRWRSQIGCPIAAAVDTSMAVQRFEHGWMFWSKDSAEIHVLITSGGSSKWSRYADAWVEGQPDRDPSLAPPPGLQQPIRGFGKVWREQLGGPGSAIGWAAEPEQGYDGGRQRYSNGLFLTGPGGQVFALFADGHWEGP